jgi:hypothetical protein
MIKMKLKTLRKSLKPAKKYDAVFITDKDREKVISFGAAGMSDFTIHHDEERKERYLNRHRKREHWDKPDTPGALSRYILWNKKTLKASLKDYKQRFNL